MRQIVVNLLLIVAVGAVLYYAVASTYTEGTANIVGLSYFLLTIRFLDLLESVEEMISDSAPSLE